MSRRSARLLVAVTSVATASALLVAASAQESRGRLGSFVPPPPSETSTGGAASLDDPLPRAGSLSALRIRGRTIETRDQLYPGEPLLVGLEQSATPYRADLPLERSPLAQTATSDREELHQRQLALYSGERVLPLPTVATAAPPEVVASHATSGEEAPQGSSSAIGAISAVVGALLLAAAAFLKRRQPKPLKETSAARSHQR